MSRQNEQEIPSLYAELQQIPDPRQAQGKRHPLPAMLSLACVALLCGRQTILAIAEWVRDYGQPYLQRFGFTHPEPPGQATWYRVLGALEWAELEARAYTWAQQVVRVLGDKGSLLGIAIDGKTLRGSKQQGAVDAHLLSAVVHELGLTLLQIAVADKTNEIGAVSELLGQLVMEGYVFTADALLTQRDVAETIVSHQGDYVFVVKDNQPGLREDIELLFTCPPPQVKGVTQPTAHSQDGEHGRIESRTLQASTALNDYLDWPGVAQVFQLVRRRIEKKSGTESIEITYGITSLSAERASAAQLLTLVRQHWTIENRSHWVRDVVFDEDRAQTRRRHLPHVMATLRNLVIGLLRSTGVAQIASARRHFAACPDEALRLLGLPA